MKHIYLMLAMAGLWWLSGCSDDDTSNPPNPPKPQPSPYKWSLQPSNFNVSLHDVFFIGNNTGWAVGEQGVILSTTSGGSDWPEVPVNSLEETFKAVFFTSAQKGWLASSAGEDLDEGNVSVTMNGGAYPEVQEAVDSPMNAVFFVDELTGWAGGNNGLILYTTNGGLAWEPEAITGKEAISDLYFPEVNQGWAATDSGGIYRTQDGTTWEQEDFEVTAALRAIHFVDTLHGWACGTQNTILRRTQEPGSAPAWTRIRIESEFASKVWTDIFFTDAQTGWVVGEGGSIYKSTDGGITWTPESVEARADYNAIFMVSNTKGWVVGKGGAILTYTP